MILAIPSQADLCRIHELGTPGEGCSRLSMLKRNNNVDGKGRKGGTERGNANHSTTLPAQLLRRSFGIMYGDG